MTEAFEEAKNLEKVTSTEIKQAIFPGEAWILGLVVSANNRDYSPTCVKVNEFKAYHDRFVKNTNENFVCVLGNRYVAIQNFAMTQKGMIILKMADVVELEKEDRDEMKDRLYSLVAELNNTKKATFGENPKFIGMPGTTEEIADFAKTLDWIGVQNEDHR